ncbi:MAG: ABC transporter permease [Acidobacteria bacterium]|nr:ABC transporter permease [Acidobacteriota bacterium]
MAPIAGQLRQVVRRLARSPMFAAVTLLTLATGMGANVALFAVVYGVLLKPLPYPESDRLVAIWQTIQNLGIPELNASPATYFLYREEGRAFEDVGLWRTESGTVTGLAEPETVPTLVVTDGTLPVLGVKPVLGRWFTRADDAPGSPETAMLSFGYWQRRFGGHRSVIGRRILVDGRAREVIGIMPDDFRFMNSKPSILLPFRFNRGEVFIGNFSYQAVARLKPGVTIPQANADIGRMLPMLIDKFPPAPGMSNKMLAEARLGPSVRPLKNDVVGDVGKVLWVLMATAGIVLFIACANVANLLLVRTEGRQQELAIRAALGAGWAQIARELLLESVALGIAGGALAVGLAYGALHLLTALAPPHLPRLTEIAVDANVLLFAAVLSVLSGIVFGLIPVMKYAGRRPDAGLRGVGRTFSEGRERHRTRSTLVVVQVALALVLLIGSGLMIRTFRALRNVEPGFTSPQEIQTLRVSIPSGQVKEPARVLRMHNGIIDRIAAIPGVRSVAAVNSITMDGFDSNDPIFAEDRVYAEGQIPPIRRYKQVTPGLFQTMGNPLLAGRDVTWTDLYEKRPVVVVSENLARELWGSAAAAIGKRVRENPKGIWREVVGVVGDERDDGVDKKAPTVVYWPLLVRNIWGAEERVQRSVAYAVRSSRAGSADLAKGIQRAVWSVHPDLPVANVRTVQEIYDRSLARTSFTLVLLAVAAGMALFLGVIGIYGVISYSVSQRTREIGIRMALGAHDGTVRRMFVRHGLSLTALGLGCGLVAAAALTRVMSALLYDVSPLDPLTYAVVCAALLCAAVAATYVPARRATRVAPVEALRSE